MECPACGVDNPPESIKCDCGFDLEIREEEKEYERQTTYRKPQKNNYGLKKSNKTLYIIIGVFAFIIALSYSCNQSGSIPAADNMTAYFASNDFVKERLKAPSTAKFPLFRQVNVTDLGGGRFRVSAYVDAQNSFGAQIRTNYTCVVKGEDSIHWILESLDM